MSYIETERLVIRQWRDSDKPLFAKLNADPSVMRYFPAILNRLESDAAITRFSRHIDQFGWGFWAADRRDTGEFISQLKAP